MQETSAALIDQLVYIDNFMLNADTPNLDVDGQVSLDLAAFADESFIFADEEKPDPPSDAEDPHKDPRPEPENQNHNLNQNQNINPDFSRLPVEQLGFHELEGSSSKAQDPWFQEEPQPLFGERQGNLLHSSLNEKIEAAKRNKYNHHGVQQPLMIDAPQPSGHILASQRNESSEEHLQSQQGSVNPSIADLSSLPKFPVPPGAETSLKQAGLSRNQIDLLSALIAQHQTTLKNQTSQNDHRGLWGTRGGSQPFSQTPVPETTVKIERRDSAQHLRADSRFSVSAVESPASINSSENADTISMGSLARHDSISNATSDGISPIDPDKRRRNTAASARFRVKKKLKEKEMEDKIQLLRDMIERFELKIDELELENRLLKNLIIEKGNRDSDEELKLLKDRARYQDQ